MYVYIKYTYVWHERALGAAKLFQRQQQHLQRQRQRLRLRQMAAKKMERYYMAKGGIKRTTTTLATVSSRFCQRGNSRRLWVQTLCIISYTFCEFVISKLLLSGLQRRSRRCCTRSTWWRWWNSDWQTEK